MSNARAAAVLSRLVDIASLLNYCLDRFYSLREPLGRGDRITVPDVSALTIYPDGSVARQAGARNTPSPNEITLVVNQEPFIPIQLPQVASTENINGAWDSQLADVAMKQLRANMDSLILDTYIAGSLCWVAAGLTTYCGNVASDSVVASDFLLQRGLLLRQKGTLSADVAWIIDPLATSAIMGLSGWQNQAVGATEFGARTIGRIYGQDVIESQAVRTSSSHATATLAHASNVITATFATNPGLFVGQPCTIAGSTDSTINGHAAFTVATVSSDGLTVTFAYTHADVGDIQQAGAAVVEACARNIICDMTHIYQAVQVVPKVEMVKDPDTTGWIMQLSSLLGYIGRVGRARLVLSPDTSL